MISVNVLLYGDFPKFAKRVLSSIRGYKPGVVQDIRVGINKVCSETRDWLFESFAPGQPVPCYVYEPSHNVGKYPLMRRMFYEERTLAPLTMWLDDDSWLDKFIAQDWWEEVQRSMVTATMTGAIHIIRQRGRQFEGVMAQPWYNQEPVGPKHTFRFATGAWWVAKSDFLTEHDYPFPDIYHNGGDSMLGELLRQQHGILKPFSRCFCHCESCSRKKRPDPAGVVHINEGGRKGRRGIGVVGEHYVWQNGPPEHPDLSRHNFSCQIHRFE